MLTLAVALASLRPMRLSSYLSRCGDVPVFDDGRGSINSKCAPCPVLDILQGEYSTSDQVWLGCTAINEIEEANISSDKYLYHHCYVASKQSASFLTIIDKPGG